MLHKPILTQSKAWLLYVCLLTMLAGCSKCNKVIDPNTAASLPPATQTGANSFGCLVNGKRWTPYGRQSILGTKNPGAVYDSRFGDFAVFGGTYLDQPINGSTVREGVSISAQNTAGVGTYNLTNSNVRFIFMDTENEYDSKTDIASNCQITITKIDMVNFIMAGTFSFTIEKRDTGKKVTVTDGRFDIKL